VVETEAGVGLQRGGVDGLGDAQGDLAPGGGGGAALHPGVATGLADASAHPGVEAVEAGRLVGDLVAGGDDAAGGGGDLGGEGGIDGGQGVEALREGGIELVVGAGQSPANAVGEEAALVGGGGQGQGGGQVGGQIGADLAVEADAEAPTELEEVGEAAVGEGIFVCADPAEGGGDVGRAAAGVDAPLGRLAGGDGHVGPAAVSKHALIEEGRAGPLPLAEATDQPVEEQGAEQGGEQQAVAGAQGGAVFAAGQGDGQGGAHRQHGKEGDAVAQVEGGVGQGVGQVHPQIVAEHISGEQAEEAGGAIEGGGAEGAGEGGAQGAPEADQGEEPQAGVPH